MTASPIDDTASPEHWIRELTKELSRARDELAEAQISKPQLRTSSE